MAILGVDDVRQVEKDYLAAENPTFQCPLVSQQQKLYQFDKPQSQAAPDAAPYGSKGRMAPVGGFDRDLSNIINRNSYQRTWTLRRLFVSSASGFSQPPPPMTARGK